MRRFLNVGGFSDVVFELLATFAAGGLDARHWVDVIEGVKLYRLIGMHRTECRKDYIAHVASLQNLVGAVHPGEFGIEFSSGLLSSM